MPAFLWIGLLENKEFGSTWMGIVKMSFYMWTMVKLRGSKFGTSNESLEFSYQGIS